MRAVRDLAPKPGSGIDSMTISSGGRSVTLTAETAKKAAAMLHRVADRAAGEASEVMRGAAREAERIADPGVRKAADRARRALDDMEPGVGVSVEVGGSHFDLKTGERSIRVTAPSAEAVEKAAEVTEELLEATDGDVEAARKSADAYAKGGPEAAEPLIRRAGQVAVGRALARTKRISVARVDEEGREVEVPIPTDEAPGAPGAPLPFGDEQAAAAGEEA